MSKRKALCIDKPVLNNRTQKDTKATLDKRNAERAKQKKAAQKARAEKIAKVNLSKKLAKAKLQPGFHSMIVPALDALIGDPKIIEPDEDTKLKAIDLFIPEQYLHRICDFRDEPSTRGEAAQELLRSFSCILEKMHQDKSDVYVCKNGMNIHIVKDVKIPAGENRKSSTVNALAVANIYNQLPNSDIAILSGDNYMISLALNNKIDVARVNPDVYTGRRKLVLPHKADVLDQWLFKGHLTKEQFHELFPDEEPLRLNEFVEFVINEDEIAARFTNGKDRGIHLRIGRFYAVRGENGKKEEPCLQQLSYCTNLPVYLKPRSAGQAMFAEALLAPVNEIPIVICPSTFGTGKTYLATGIGLNLVEKGNFDRIFLCPRDSELGKEIGFLPGDEREKTLAKAMPIVDNIRAYIKNRTLAVEHKTMGNAELNTWVDRAIEKNFELVSIINMGGRSISDSWIIYDEAQDMERFQINQLMKRIGNGSKMIITGDPHQVFNRHMNEHSNGLSYAASKMAGSEYVAVISMSEKEITRSVAAQEIARLLDH